MIRGLNLYPFHYCIMLITLMMVRGLIGTLWFLMNDNLIAVETFDREFKNCFCDISRSFKFPELHNRINSITLKFQKKFSLCLCFNLFVLWKIFFDDFIFTSLFINLTAHYLHIFTTLKITRSYLIKKRNFGACHLELSPFQVVNQLSEMK